MGTFTNLIKLVSADDHVVNCVWAIRNPQRACICVHAREWSVLRNPYEQQAVRQNQRLRAPRLRGYRSVP